MLLLVRDPVKMSVPGKPGTPTTGVVASRDIRRPGSLRVYAGFVLHALEWLELIVTVVALVVGVAFLVVIVLALIVELGGWGD
jgi:hypothetical protein